MHFSRQRILEILKERGAATVDELSQELSLTTVTVRHHLDVLRSEGLVSDPEVRHRATPGRPQYSYALTSHAASVFPTNYAGLALEMINELKTHSSEQELAVLFEGVGRRILAGSPQPAPGEPLEFRLDQAVGFLNSHGYLARWEPEQEGYRLHTCNCPYIEVSGAHQELCCMDLALVNSLVGVSVERQGRVIEGHSSCSYLVRAEAVPKNA